MGAIQLEETLRFTIGFVSGCNSATYHSQQNLQKSCFPSCCYLLLTVQLSKLPHATILLFASILAEYKTKSACENQELKLHCQESKFLIIYSATYGRWAHEENVCSTEVERVPPFGMFLHCCKMEEDRPPPSGCTETGRKLQVQEQWHFGSASG